MRRNIPATIGRLLAIFTVAFWVSSTNAEQFYVGNTVYNVCMKLPLFEAPDRDTALIGVLDYGDSAHVASVHGKYHLPDSDPSSEASQRSRVGRNVDAILPSLYKRIEWAHLTGLGYASASCLVKQELFPKQQKSVALEKVGMLVPGIGKHGFSEDEEGDLIGMQGAAGKAKKKNSGQSTCRSNQDGDLIGLQGAAGKAKKKKNAQYACGSFDDYLDEFFLVYEFENNTQFRRQGGLGEFR